MMNNEVLKQPNSIEATVKRHPLRWSGHVARMPKMSFFCELAPRVGPH